MRTADGFTGSRFRVGSSDFCRTSKAGWFVNLGIIGQAVGLFAVTNVDDILILALFFAQGAGHRGSTRRIVLGQYLGFAAILVVAVAAALGATFLPEPVIPYLGLLPLALGLKAAWQAWKHRGEDGDDEDRAQAGGPTSMAVAAVTLANGGDNIGVYVPVFATAGIGGMSVYAVVFLILVAVWCFAGRFVATRPVIGTALARWGHILLPVVLIAIGLLILVEGGAFGL
ncbi:cadmium resistance transporter [Streptomyces umbrinus]|uniref:cadmium resistance transporter n=1 Tax=Streptomyces umbrinus TaxID=67370 RepID=UPI003F4D6FE8